MRKIVSTIMMLMLTMGIAAQTYYTRPCFDKKLQKDNGATDSRLPNRIKA